MRAWKNQWLETFTRRLAWVQEEIPAARLRWGVGGLAVGCAGLTEVYIELLWALWDSVPRIGVGAIALAGVLNSVLLVRFIMLIGQIDLKRAITQIQWLGGMNLLLELGGVALGGILTAQGRTGSRVIAEFFYLQSINLVATLSMVWFAHSLKRYYESRH